LVNSACTVLCIGIYRGKIVPTVIIVGILPVLNLAYASIQRNEIILRLSCANREIGRVQGAPIAPGIYRYDRGRAGIYAATAPVLHNGPVSGGSAKIQGGILMGCIVNARPVDPVC
jgi:hypothetical protein